MDEVHFRDNAIFNVEVGQIRDQRNAVADNVSSLKDNFLLKRKRFFALTQYQDLGNKYKS